MKKKNLKKILLGLGLSLMVTMGMTAVTFAASEDTVLENPTMKALPAPSSMSQTGATSTSITASWSAVSGAQLYQVEIAPYGSSTYQYVTQTSKTSLKITGLKAQSRYTIKVFAGNSYDPSGYTNYLNVRTAPKAVSIAESRFSGNSCTFRMNYPSDYGAVTGYRVKYTNCKTKGTATKYFDNPSGFSIGFKKNIYYKVTITPYIKANGKRFYSSGSTTKYVASQPALSKSSSTSSSMTVKWPAVYGATNYSVYIKKPGSSSFKKVSTTKAKSYRLTGMKMNQYYYIRVVANKKAGNKNYQSDKQGYYGMRIYTVYR